MSEHLHRIRLKEGEITIEVEGSDEFVERHFDRLYERHIEDTRPLVKESSETRAASETQKERSLAEIYSQSEPSTKQDRALVTGWYLEKEDSRDDFTRSEIEQKGQAAKIDLEENLNRDMNELVSSGYIDEINERDGEDVYHLTISGEEYVENELMEGAG